MDCADDTSALGNADAKLRQFPRLWRDLETITEASRQNHWENNS
jgi:hypothetical protein